MKKSLDGPVGGIEALVVENPVSVEGESDGVVVAGDRAGRRVAAVSLSEALITDLHPVQVTVTQPGSPNTPVRLHTEEGEAQSHP